MSGPAGEMPFLEHLEELRIRLIRSLVAVAIGVGIGIFVVQQFELVSILKVPIAPYLGNTGGKLAVLSPTAPVMIVLKLSFIVGLVLSSPVVLYQTWAFLSPGLYDREKRTILPALFVGLLLFLTGAFLGYVYLLPEALRVLFSFQADALALVITYDEYFSFVLQVVLAMGLSFELPLIIVILAALGLVTPAGLNRFRRYSIVLSFIAGAVLSPGTDVVSMLLMTFPLLLLYEIGFAGCVLVHRRRLRRQAASVAVVVLLLAGAAGSLSAQQPGPAPPGSVYAPVPGLSRDSIRRDTTRAGVLPLDTAKARRLGLPTSPSHSFATPDSMLSSLLAKPGYDAIRFRSDSATLLVEQRRILLHGGAMAERHGSILEADSINYQEATCTMVATGEPHLFDAASVLVGDEIRYDACERRGVVDRALTSFNQAGAVWFLRGNVAQDSSSARIYAAHSEVTSCDLPEPHYHFQAGEVKWISKSFMVARPAVLYVRDVPVLWLPFIFQDTRPGRRSGLLIPQFGINDLVRPDGNYNRQVTNVGYYWAINNYIDLLARLDWFANRYVQYGASVQYRWSNQFLRGAISVDRQRQVEGSSSFNLRWTHQQSFNLSTTLTFDMSYVGNTTVLSQNAIDPLLSTRAITSSLNFTKRYSWGSVALGGNRRQSLTDQGSTTQLPALTVSPKPIDFGNRHFTWSPAFSLTNNLSNGVPLGSPLLVTDSIGRVDTVKLKADARVTQINFDSPVRIGAFTWRNAFRMADMDSTGRATSTVKIADTTTADPTDSIYLTQVLPGGFTTGIDWDTGINLPVLFGSSWKLQPGLGVANSTGGPFLLRNTRTNGNWVQQGKRFSFTVGASPTFFGFLPGFGPFSRIRHSISPALVYNYSPSANIPRAYAEAITLPGQPPVLRSDPTQTLSLGLNTVFEAKKKPPQGDTTAAAAAKKIRLLGLIFSPLSYDLEQAKKPGRRGWVTQTISTTFQTDLLPSFSLGIGTDLWKGQASSDTAKFSPYITNVNASFAISGATVASLFGGGRKAASTSQNPPPAYGDDQSRPWINRYYNSVQTPVAGGRRGFTANFNYSLTRSRPIPGSLVSLPSQSNLGLSTTFSPTAFWSVSWSTQYNITASRFESQVVRLERDLHEWRASFSFVRNPNGNVAFYFSIYLSDLPELKVGYNQTTIGS